jgi:hypothetical protein
MTTAILAHVEMMELLERALEFYVQKVFTSTIVLKIKVNCNCNIISEMELEIL